MIITKTQSFSGRDLRNGAIQGFIDKSGANEDNLIDIVHVPLGSELLVTIYFSDSACGDEEDGEGGEDEGEEEEEA